jgi:paraquat-inducible protein A
MLDVFVIALLTVLVDFGFLSSIHVAPAATYFCIVVASTMFAAITFDPRIMWDACAAGNDAESDEGSISS